MRLTIPVLATLAALAPPLAASASPQGWYLGLEGGWAASGSVNQALAPPAGPQQGTVDFAEDGVFGVSAGYRFALPLRLEAGLGFADYRAKFLRPDGAAASSLDGGVSTASFIASAVYDIPLSPQFSLSVGLGLGAAEVDPSIRDPLGNHLHDSQAVFAWRLFSGLTTTLRDDLELQVGYRYEAAGDSIHSFFAGSPSSVTLGAKHAHEALISLRWFVASPSSSSEPAHTGALPHYIPPSSAPPARSPPSSLTRTFAVYFDLDSSTLDDKAVETVALATETARQGDAIKIQIMGGTDAAAPVIHNMDLCERRAVAVKAQLVSDGILEGDIAIKGKLFEPLFGGSEIADSYYRRAEIDLGA